jgi:hypothetical protein
MWILSFQGISDAVADGYIDRHGNVTWAAIAASLATNPGCDKLHGYWAFTDCRYHKGFQTCAEPNQFGDCPLPRHRLRNGRLNQTAYSLFLFIRDITGGDIVGWIDRQLADYPGSGNLPAALDQGGPLSIPWSTTSFIEPESWTSLQLPIRTARPATGQAAALTFSSTLPRGLMPAGSIQGFPRCFRGSCNTRFGGTAPNRASTSATAIRSTTAAGARTCGVGCTAAAIGSFCTLSQKSPKNRLF